VPAGAPQIQVILASTRVGRFGEKPAAWVMDRLSARADLVAELIDLRDYPLPLFDQPAPAARTLRDYPNDAIARWGGKVDEADGFILITPEYNHGYPASLKNALWATETSAERGRSSSCVSSHPSSRWPRYATPSTFSRT
jgi:NAD(P)H-dependent FMN reductase